MNLCHVLPVALRGLGKSILSASDMSTAESQPSYPTPVRAVSTETDSNFPPPPENKETTPFSVLSSLFDRLQGERKPEKRYRLLNSWFNVYLQVLSYYVLKLIYLTALAKRERLRSISSPEAHPAVCESVAHPCVSHPSRFLSERQRAFRVWSQREEPGQSVHKTHPTWIKGPRRSSPPPMETTCREIGANISPLGFLDSNASQRSTSGDFPSILYEVISKRSSVIKGTLTIDDVNRYLDEIHENIGNQDEQSKILQKIYNRATPDEQRWVVRIILKGRSALSSCSRLILIRIYKDMNISVKDTTVFAVLHPDAQDLYNTCSDLKKVAWRLWDPNRRLGDEVGYLTSDFSHITDSTKGKRVHLFRAFTPMLCRRPTKLEESVKEMQGKTFIVEEKLDGERMQLHKRDDEFFYCSRCVCVDVWARRKYLIRLQEGKRLHIPLRRSRGHRQLDTFYRFCL